MAASALWSDGRRSKDNRMKATIPRCCDLSTESASNTRREKRRANLPIALAACIVATWLALAQSSGHVVDTPRPTEAQVKAIYLYNFAKFVTWPEASSANGAPITICLDHADAFLPVLRSAVAGEKIDGRNVVVKRLTTAAEAAGCAILYIDASQDSRSAALLQIAAGHSVLTVSDIAGFAKDGGAIEFVLEGGRVRFKVNLAATQKAGLVLSSQLLKVAQSVSGKASMEANR